LTNCILKLAWVGVIPEGGHIFCCSCHILSYFHVGGRGGDGREEGPSKCIFQGVTIILRYAVIPSIHRIICSVPYFSVMLVFHLLIAVDFCDRERELLCERRVKLKSNIWGGDGKCRTLMTLKISVFQRNK